VLVLKSSKKNKEKMEEQLKTIFTACIVANVPLIADEVIKRLNATPRPIHTLERREAAEQLGVSLPTLDGLIKDGTIRAKKIGRRVLIPQQEIETLLESGEPIKYRRA